MRGQVIVVTGRSTGSLPVRVFKTTERLATLCPINANCMPPHGGMTRLQQV